MGLIGADAPAGGQATPLRCGRCEFEDSRMADFFDYILPGWGWVGVGVGEDGIEYQKWCPKCVSGMGEDGPIPVEDYPAYGITRSPCEVSP